MLLGQFSKKRKKRKDQTNKQIKTPALKELMPKQNKGNATADALCCAGSEDGSDPETNIQGPLSLSEASSQGRRKEPSWCPARTAPGHRVAAARAQPWARIQKR